MKSTAKNLIEALLFVAYEPLTVKRLAEVSELSSNEVRDILLIIQNERAGTGFELVEIAEGWQFLTNPDFAFYVERLYNPRKQQLSQAALETLAIIAYRQPISRLEIENIRQVKADAMIGRLLEKNLIKEVGRRDTPGRPILYGTTKEFLSAFGLRSLKELPPLETFAQTFENLSEEQDLFTSRSAYTYQQQNGQVSEPQLGIKAPSEP